jgi:hypothetical protein
VGLPRSDTTSGTTLAGQGDMHHAEHNPKSRDRLGKVIACYKQVIDTMRGRHTINPLLTESAGP